MLIAARFSPAFRVAPAILQPEDAILTNQDVKETSCGVIDHDQMQLAIRVKAWRGYKAKLYPMQDLRDVEQELMLYVLERIDRFDPERGTFATFLKHALKGGIATIARRSQSYWYSSPWHCCRQRNVTEAGTHWAEETVRFIRSHANSTFGSNSCTKKPRRSRMSINVVQMKRGVTNLARKQLRCCSRNAPLIRGRVVSRERHASARPVLDSGKDDQARIAVRCLSA